MGSDLFHLLILRSKLLSLKMMSYPWLFPVRNLEITLIFWLDDLINEIVITLDIFLLKVQMKKNESNANELANRGNQCMLLGI